VFIETGTARSGTPEKAKSPEEWVQLYKPAHEASDEALADDLYFGRSQRTDD
jgi:hypothetical protein